MTCSLSSRHCACTAWQALGATCRSRVRHRDFKYARVFVLGTTRKKSGIDALLYERTFNAALGMGVQLASGSQVADSNPEIFVPLSRMGRADITWRVYRHRGADETNDD